MAREVWRRHNVVGVSTGKGTTLVEWQETIRCGGVRMGWPPDEVRRGLVERNRYVSLLSVRLSHICLFFVKYLMLHKVNCELKISERSRRRSRAHASHCTEIPSLLRNPDFRAIEDRTREKTFVGDRAVEERLCHMSANTLGLVSGITKGKCGKIISKARRRRQVDCRRRSPHESDANQEQIEVQVMLHHGAQCKFVRKRDFFRECLLLNW
jgi:hypothetical protein